MDGRFVGLYSVGNDMHVSPHGVAETQIIRGRTGISFLLSDGHPSCFMVWFGAAQTIW